MVEAVGMVLMVVGGLLLLSATRSFALYHANRGQPATRAFGRAWLRLVAVMLILGGALLGVGYLLAF